MIKKGLAIDFDGVLCDSFFPEADHQNLVNKFFLRYAKRKQKQGWLVTLWTCRTDHGKEKYTFAQQKAITFLKSLGFIPDFVNENDPERIKKYDADSRKMSSDIVIDDRNIGLLGWFLRFVDKQSKRKMVRSKVNEVQKIYHRSI